MPLILNVLPQNGMQTPDIESKTVNPPMGSAGLPTSHKAICLSLIFENPVVARRLCSPIHTTLLFFAPVCPETSCAARSCLTSHTRSFLSLEVVASIAPFALHERLWTMSLCFNASCALPLSMSHSLIVKSPEADARIFSAAGLNRTCPTFLFVVRDVPSNSAPAYLECPLNFEIGATSAGSSASEYSVKPCGTCQTKTFPSSEPEAMMRSLNGFLPSSAPSLLSTAAKPTNLCPKPAQYVLGTVGSAQAIDLSH